MPISGSDLLLIKASHKPRDRFSTNGFQQSLKSNSSQSAAGDRNAGKTRQTSTTTSTPKILTQYPPRAGNSGGGNSPIASNSQKGFLGGLFDFFSGRN
jgi:hypothetical protein